MEHGTNVKALLKELELREHASQMFENKSSVGSSNRFKKNT